LAVSNQLKYLAPGPGISRHDLGKEKFIERIWQWKEKYGNIILDQLKKLGSSCDWSRTRFTLDEGYVKAVEEAFSHYYGKGWIYRDKRVVNWCVRCKTSLSDLEVDYREEKANLWHIRYPLKIKNQNIKIKNNFIVVATTRPETMLGDTAVAVNPKDERYKNLIGEKVILPLVDREIPIVADNLVDKEFGTGAVKVTPAHDLIDQEIGKKHNLESIQVIGEDGKITSAAPLPYQRLSVKDARLKIVEDLQNAGMIEKIEEYVHQVPNCARCNTTIELIPSMQWFLKMSELAKLALGAVKTKKVKFYPAKWEKGYVSWLKNIKDWCISRQLWWGHKIPLENETDVLDTWFSSALWPFAALGWPTTAKDLKIFYPTNVLVTGRDIINLWVARMVYSGMEFIKEAPFSDVYINATILTKEGKRMSKSLGTGIDPLNLIEKFGADATRFGIIWQVSGGQDMKFSEEAMFAGQKFCNKIWNATRFILMNKYPRINTDFGSLRSQRGLTRIKKLTAADKRILKALDKTIKAADKNLENYRFGKALQDIYNFFWHDFCDRYIEQSKSEIRNPKLETRKVLFYVLLTSLKLLHPFIPFITEEIYQNIPLSSKKKCLMVENWPATK